MRNVKCLDVGNIFSFGSITIITCHATLQLYEPHTASGIHCSSCGCLLYLNSQQMIYYILIVLFQVTLIILVSGFGALHHLYFLQVTQFEHIDPAFCSHHHLDLLQGTYKPLNILVPTLKSFNLTYNCTK